MKEAGVDALAALIRANGYVCKSLVIAIQFTGWTVICNGGHY
jgi:hypothetical protein